VPEMLADGKFGGWLAVCHAPATAVHRYWCPAGHEVQRGTCPAHRPAGQTGCRQCFERGLQVPMKAELVADLT
jgi:hypothetical protein